MNPIVILGMLTIPLSPSAGWQSLSFSKIKPNQVEIKDGRIDVKVNQSAGPLVLPLKETTSVTGFRVKLKIEGAIKETDSPFPEDAYFRLGLVAPGKRRMNRMERMFAAKWVKTLFDLAPKDSGIDKIYFYNLVPPKWPVGSNRVFPGSKDLMSEKIVANHDGKNGEVILDYKLDSPVNTAALWLSPDGDDTQSEFSLVIQEITLRGPDKSGLDKSSTSESPSPAPKPVH
ncbi:MAG: hypothetical protein AB7F86_11200 [Bdellovibrionales bacterium]